MLSTLSIRQKAQQTAVLRIRRDQFVADQVGAAFFFGEIITEASDIGLENGRKLLARYKENAEIPLLITSDFENGCGSMLKGLTILPYMMSLGAANDKQLAYDYGRATALEARSVGANWTFSPVCDLNINDRNPLVNVRGLTDDAETDMICSAVYHHDDKLAVDSPMDEVLKDADVIHHCMNDLSKAVKNKEKARFDSLCREFGM